MVIGVLVVCSLDLMESSYSGSFSTAARVAIGVSDRITREG